MATSFFMYTIMLPFGIFAARIRSHCIISFFFSKLKLADILSVGLMEKVFRSKVMASKQFQSDRLLFEVCFVVRRGRQILGLSTSRIQKFYRKIIAGSIERPGSIHETKTGPFIVFSCFLLPLVHLSMTSIQWRMEVVNGKHSGHAKAKMFATILKGGKVSQVVLVN